MRLVILIPCLLPFLYYAAKDNAFHFSGRKVSRTEHILHAAIGLTLALVFTHAFLGHDSIMVGALVLFAAAGAIDEYIFHRGIPGIESDLHAKEHLALLIFVIVAMLTGWLERSGWQVGTVIEKLRSGASL